MAEFAYLAIAPSGKEQRGHIAAETIAAARAELDRRRLFVMRIDSETRRAAAPALFSLERTQLYAKELTLFTRPASTLTQELGRASGRDKEGTEQELTGEGE